MSFLAPLGLLLGALAVPLVALYFLKLRRRRVKVPSTLLWQVFLQSERLATPFERFRRHLLLWLQLLALLLLTLALARPYLKTNAPLARSVVLVLDTSASMGATDVRPTRLQEAAREARRIVDALGPTDEAMLVTAGPTTEVKVPFTRDKGKLDAALDGLRATEAQGSLRDGLQLALSMARARSGLEVAVFSDGGSGDLHDLPLGKAQVRYEPVGSSATNAGILAVDLRRSPTADLDRELFVTVQGFGGAPLSSAVEVYVDDALVGQRDETLQPDTPVHLVFDLPAQLSGQVRVKLDTPGDVLAADDQAWLVMTPLALRKVLLVGGDALTARALAADPRVRLTRVAPAALTRAQIDAADVAFFGAGTVPSDLGGHNYAVLGPLPGSPVRFGDEVKAPQVLGWVRTHPALRFVRWNDVLVARSRAVVDSGGLRPIVDSDGGPLVLAGEVDGGRVLQLAFAPLESDLPLRVAWPVTLLDTVGWLSEGTSGAEEARSVATGTPWVWRLPSGVDPGSVTVTGPAGRAVDAVVADGLLRVRDTSRVGVYEVHGAGLQARFAANLLSPRESDVAPRTRLDLAGGGGAIAQASLGGRRELWRPLALCALLLLLGEWVTWSRRASA